MSKNDDRVRSLLNVVEKKREALGSRPKAAWESNGLYKGNITININTINKLSDVVSLYAEIHQKRESYLAACKDLGCSTDLVKDMISHYDEWVTDLKLKAKIITWDAEKKELSKLETQLKALRSEDAKTEDLLGDITASLGV